jgi:hypothetical protein
VHCAQVGIAEDINHEVFRRLLESQNSYALHLQGALSYFLCELAYKTLGGGFPDEEICCFWNLRISLRATVPGQKAVRLSHGYHLSCGLLCSLCG